MDTNLQIQKFIDSLPSGIMAASEHDQVHALCNDYLNTHRNAQPLKHFDVFQLLSKIALIYRHKKFHKSLGKLILQLFNHSHPYYETLIGKHLAWLQNKSLLQYSFYVSILQNQNYIKGKS